MSVKKKKEDKSFLEGLKLYEDDHKIEPEFIFSALEEVAIKTYRNYIDAPDAKVRVAFKDNVMHVFHQFDVIEDNVEIYDETLEMHLKDTKDINPDAKVGDIVEVEVDFSTLGRNSINMFKQLLKQKTKDYERKRVYEEYKDRVSDMITGIIKTVEDKCILIDIKNTIGVMVKNEQIPGEQYREGQSIKVIIKKVSDETKGSQVSLSRADEMFIRRLFEKAVPEIAQGIVEIKAIAREAGERTKMAVYSRNEDIDPIGACIGPRGSRVQEVISEVRGEQIDVFEWNDDIGELVKNALTPAEVKACFYSDERIDPELTPEELEKAIKHDKRPLVVVVADEKLSVAIGKGGKNAKLAVKLTDRKIDIKSESAIAELGIDVEKEEEIFREDQLRIAKEKEIKKFQELQEEAMKRQAEADEVEVEHEVLPEDVLEEIDTPEVEVTIDEIKQEENIEQLSDVEVEVVEEVKEEEKPEKVKKAPKKPLTPKTDYVSKFEEFADSSKKETTSSTKKKKKSGDDDRRVRAEDLVKQEYGEIRPEYSEEELEEIRLLEEAEDENSWINDDDIDFDEYDEYYDEDN